jgi:hypothetical protein
MRGHVEPLLAHLPSSCEVEVEVADYDGHHGVVQHFKPFLLDRAGRIVG